MSSLPGFEKSLHRDHDNDYRTGTDMEGSDMTLYAQQAAVDRLPVPALKDTLDLYLRSTLPLLSPQEFAATKEATEKFAKTIGPVLQQRLIQRKEALPDSSWFSSWWNDVAYLGYRDTVVHNVSYYLQFQDELAHAMQPQRRAARFIHHAVGFRKQVVNGTLSPDMKKGNKPMSNTQWKFVFNTCRMPQEKLDFVRTYAGDVFKHIAVARNNRFFVVDVVDENGDSLGMDHLEVQFKRIISYADSMGESPLPIGILTSTNRDTWTKNRKLLLDSNVREINESCLESIQSSMFLLCFDSVSPTTREEVGKALLHSDGKNRFWDKSFQLVFFENGRAGYVGEHSMTDGLTTTRFVNETLEKLFSDSDELKLPTSELKVSNGIPEPTMLNFQGTSEISRAISEATLEFDALVREKELKVLMFHGFGKNKIKTFKCSPDAFAQVAIQLAYYKTFGFCKATYESTQTRSFLHGRTEVTRSCSIDSLNFARMLVDVPKQPSLLTPTYLKDSYNLMMKALQAHVGYIGKASKAQGCDRHLLGLKLLLKTGEDGSFFQDPAYSRTGSWAISTSGLVGERMDGWGFGEVVPDGIGVGYSVQNERLRFTVTSRHQWAEKFLGNMEKSLLQMQALAELFTPAQKAKM